MMAQALDINKLNSFYHDGILDGDIVMLTSEYQGRPEGTTGIIEIRWDEQLRSPVRSIRFDEDDCVSGIQHEGLEYEKLGEDA